LGSEPATFYSQSGYDFPMQFFDVFNPRVGGGIYLMSKDLNNRARRYYLSKNDGGVSLFLEYPELYTHLQPNKSYTFPETVVGVPSRRLARCGCSRTSSGSPPGTGPFESQDKAWYREAFWLLAEDRGRSRS